MTKPTLTAGITCQARGKSYAIAFPQAPDVLAAHRILDPERPDSASPVLLATSDIPRAALERYAELFRVKLLQAAGYSSARGPLTHQRLAAKDAPPPEVSYDHPAWGGLKLAARERLAKATWRLWLVDRLNRSDLCAIGEVSIPQAANDIREMRRRLPHLGIRYDRKAKCYRMEKRS